MPTILANKRNNIEHFAAPSSAPVMSQPIILDFSAYRKKIAPRRLGLMLALLLLPALIVSALSATFLMGQLLGMKRYNAAPPQVSLALEPLPSEQLSPSRDAPAAAPSRQVDLVPILETLPLYASHKSRAKPVALPASGGMEVEVAPPTRQSRENSMFNEADDAFESGDTEQAVRLYTRVLESNPNDAEARANLVALWLSVASREDHAGRTGEALAAYDNALHNWRGSRETEEAIWVRMRFWEGKMATRH